MKHVFGTDEIAHLWMHQTQTDARNPQGNFYFDGDTIYSYGSHFPIARHVVNAAGRKAILFTTKTNSVTTAKHIGLVRRAVHGNEVPVLRVWNVDSAPDAIRETFDRHIKIALEFCYGTSGRFRPTQYKELEVLVIQANTWAKWADIPERWMLPDTAEVKEQIAAAAERKRIAQVKAEKKRRADDRARAKKMQAAFDAWVSGDTSVSPYAFDYGRLHPCALRLSADGSDIETSQGVSFPVAHALRGIALIRACVATGREYKRNGHTLHLGHYVIDSVDAQGNVKAGCHHVSYQEVERIAGILQARGMTADQTEMPAAEVNSEV